MPNSGRKAVNLHYPADVAWRAKADAALRKITLTEWMVEAARAKLAGGCPCEEERPPAAE